MLEENYYKTFQDFLAPYFKNKIQKISVNAGLNCPNRDGTIGKGGCTYCNNKTFNPEYCRGNSDISGQLTKGIGFFSRKYKNMEYLAYFQAYTNTYGPFEKLKKLYNEALSVPKVKGLVIGTRPDCITEELLCHLELLSKKYFILIEYGVESTIDRTLQKINRGHTYKTAKETIIKTANKGIHTCAHIILGLPGESEEDMLHHADEINKLPLDIIKLHQLQIIKGTTMEKQYKENPGFVKLFSPDEYADIVVKFIKRLRKDIAIDRFISQSPKELLIAPDWGIKNYQFLDIIKKKLTL